MQTSGIRDTAISSFSESFSPDRASWKMIKNFSTNSTKLGNLEVTKKQQTYLKS